MIPMMPGSESRAASSTAARSRDGSPKLCWTCRPSQIAPESRTIAGAAIGSRLHSSIVRLSPVGVLIVSGAVAAGTSSRSATMSHSPGRPSNGRATKASAAPPGAP